MTRNDDDLRNAKGLITEVAVHYCSINPKGHNSSPKNNAVGKFIRDFYHEISCSQNK